MKKKTKIVNGHSVSYFKDYSTISSEWVVNTENFSDRFNARKFTLKDAIAFLIELEEIKAGA